MYCLVYPMRRRGVKLPTEAIRAGEVRGWFTYARMPAGQPSWVARLTAANGHDVLPSLVCASIQTVKGGLLVSGFVDSINSQPEGQSWWCVPDLYPPPGPPPVNLADRRR